MTKILHIGKYYPPAKGGMENHLLLLAQELNCEIDIEILVSSKRFKGTDELWSGIPVRRMARLGTVSNAPICPALPYWMRKLSADIIHIHLPNPWGTFVYNFVRPRGKVVITYHSDIVGRGVAFKMFRPLQERLLGDAKRIIATSPDYVESSPVLPDFREKIEVIPLGIELEKFEKTSKVAERAEEIRSRYDRNGLVLFVGRLARYKGVSYLIRAMKNLEGELAIIGSGELEATLKHLAHEKLELNNVQFVGEIDFDELLAHYYAADLFCLPSVERSEAFGIVQLEAMACGKPVVSTDLDTGVPYVNQDEETGVVVPPEDVSALESAISSLLDNPNLREEYGQKARERVRDNFTKEKMAESTMAIYRNLISD